MKQRFHSPKSKKTDEYTCGRDYCAVCGDCIACDGHRQCRDSVKHKYNNKLLEADRD